MGVFKNFRSLFIVDDGSKPPSKKAEKPKLRSIPEPPPITKGEEIIPESNEGSPGKVSSKFSEVLFAAMEKNNLQGFDYLEYKQSLKSLEKMPMDEPTRYKSAFAMAKTMGATPQILIDTANHYINVLNKEEKKFELALTGQKDRKIKAKQEQLQHNDAIIAEKTKLIENLTKEIAALQKKKVSLQKEIKLASSKVETTKNNFIASYNNLVSQISLDIENMKNYLK